MHSACPDGRSSDKSSQMHARSPRTQHFLLTLNVSHTLLHHDPHTAGSSTSSSHLQPVGRQTRAHGRVTRSLFTLRLLLSGGISGRPPGKHPSPSQNLGSITSASALRLDNVESGGGHCTHPSLVQTRGLSGLHTISSSGLRLDERGDARTAVGVEPG